MRLAALALVVAPALAAQAPDTKIHWYLDRQLERAAPGDELPVYFVMRDRIGYDHWFPRVRKMPLAERRATVVRELRAHAAATQSDLLALLHRRERDGAVGGIFCNWLGNFVQCRATPAVIREVARLDSVAELRVDAAWPIEQVEDAAPVRPLTPGAAVPYGYGSVHLRCTEVWALGFRGEGVLVMNADSGIHEQYGALVNRMWTNPGEITGNGIDDDGNGFIDDVHGWNFFDQNNDISDDPNSYHGTLTAGCIAADGGCFGGLELGSAPGASIMTGKLGIGPGTGGPINPASEVAQWNAVQYAIQMGADIQTSAHSYKNGFVPPPDYAMHRYVADNSLAAGLIRTNSTSNNGTLCSLPMNPSRRPFNIAAPGNVPPPYLDPNQTLVGRRSGVIGVGSHDINSLELDPNSPCGPTAWYLEDLLAVLPSYPVANWNPADNDYPWQGGTAQGLLKPDVTGPINTVSAISVNGSTCQVGITGGTSTATPRVAGCFALWKQANPSLGPEDIAMVAHQAAVDDGAVPGKENGWGAGRVDALRGLYLALCVHRVEGDPAWTVDVPVGGPATWSVDTVPNKLAVMVFATQRTATWTGRGVLGWAARSGSCWRRAAGRAATRR
jgi:hypothetical protein